MTGRVLVFVVVVSLLASCLLISIATMLLLALCGAIAARWRDLKAWIGRCWPW